MMRRYLIALAAVGLLAATACGSGGANEAADSGTSQAASAADGGENAHTVHLPKSYRFEPASISVEVGDEVTWINEDDFPHTVQLLDPKGPDNKLGVGESVTIPFRKAGTFTYNCSLHPTQMEGQVVVTEPAGDQSSA